MSWIWKGIPIPTLVALLLLILGGLLHIIGVATPYWHEELITNVVQIAGKNRHSGLWSTCLLSGIETFECTTLSPVPGYIVATRALVILALLFGALCIVITGLWQFLRLEKYTLFWMIGSLLSGFLAGLLGMIGIIVYAANNARNKETLIGQLTDPRLSWSFALCTLSACLGIIATGLIGLGTRMKA